MYAVIRIRGNINVSPKVSKTLELLNLKRVNNMSIWPETKQILKMLKTAEGYATFGKINEETLKEVISKKGKPIDEKINNEKTVENLMSGKKMKEVNITNCFRMNPPKKGFERKGIKKHFKIGGALGNREEKINELIKKMM